MNKKEILYQLYFYKACGFKFISQNEFVSDFSYKPSLRNFSHLNSEIQNCNLCGLCKSRTHSVIGNGNLKANIMIVAEFPSKNDDKVGKANLDDGLANLLHFLGITQDKIYFTHMIKCRSNFGFMDKAYFEQCKGHFEEELRFLQPNIIVTLGKELFYQLKIEADCVFESVRGGIFKFRNSLIMPTYSLEQIEKNPSFKDDFINDLTKLKGFI